MRDMIRIRFEGTLDVDAQVLEAVHGDALQAVQNELGFSGAGIIDAQVDDYLGDEPPEVSDPLSYEHLGDIDSEMASHFWGKTDNLIEDEDDPR